ncbi:MAG: hypothetical protein PHH85_07570 [Candidatus Methanoperedens sp.]|nr:hypothetical protein [Candidatus Methanoperedens sp.]
MENSWIILRAYNEYRKKTKMGRPYTFTRYVVIYGLSIGNMGVITKTLNTHPSIAIGVKEGRSIG